MPKLVLVVDDDPSLQVMLRAILEEENYEVAIAGDGIVALEMVANKRPSLILLDLKMPRMDGLTLAQELQKRGLRPSIPIVVLTADAHAKQRASQLGAEGYLTKPFDLLDLLDEVSRHIA